MRHPMREEEDQEHTQRQAGILRELAEVSAFFDACIEQHDYEDEQHHDRAGVDDNLHRSDKLRAEQQIEHGERNHDQNQRERAVNWLAREDQRERAQYGEQRAKEEYDKGQSHPWFTSSGQTFTSAVITRFASETGSRNFQPKDISWS